MLNQSMTKEQADKIIIEFQEKHDTDEELLYCAGMCRELQEFAKASLISDSCIKDDVCKNNLRTLTQLLDIATTLFVDCDSNWRNLEEDSCDDISPEDYKEWLNTWCGIDTDAPWV